MGVKKLFSLSGQRKWSTSTWKIKRKNEFDAQYEETLTLRCPCVEYDAIMEGKNNCVPNGSFIKKLTEITRLPQSVVNAVLLDFVDLILLTVSKNKSVSIYSFGRFFPTNDEKIISFIPSNAFINQIKELKDKLSFSDNVIITSKTE